ncbi:MAG: RNA-binding protein [Candidatus Uhrbacteria bacterium]
MSTRLYIGNLSYQTTDESLKTAFEQAGQVISASVISDRMTGRSRGFGFVEMEDADAQAAIQMWDGKVLDSRPLRVNVAQAPRNGGGGGGGGGDRGGDRGGHGGSRGGYGGGGGDRY